MAHIRRFCFVDWGGRVTSLRRFVYFATSFGHQAVVVFFVLSGFLVGTSIVEASLRGTWSWKRYAMRRFTRLYVVLLPTLALTWAWDVAGLSIAGTTGIYAGKGIWRHIGVPVTTDTLTVPAFLGNLLFLQDIRVPTFGANTPLWTLAFEFWSYVLFPLMYRAAIGDERRSVRLMFALGAGAILFAGGELIRICFAFWALGAVLAIVGATKPALLHGLRNQMSAAVLLFAAGALVSDWRLLPSRFLVDLALGITTALLFATLFARGRMLDGEHGRSRPSPFWTIGRRLAGFSYTLYAAQYPALLFIEATIVGTPRWKPSYEHGAVGVVIGLGVIAYAFVLSELTERHTEDVRRWFERRPAP